MADLLEAAREIDIDGIPVRQGDRLDRRCIYETLEPLAAVKERPDIVTDLRRLERKHQR